MISDKRRVGLIGDPVAHSYSPRLQQAAFDALGIAAYYELWQTSGVQLPMRVQSLRNVDCFGANVTIPHKKAVLPLLDHIDPLAAHIGAVNTIVQRAGLLWGYNTDAPGLLLALQEHSVGEGNNKATSLQGYTAILLGAGGAARGAAFALAGAGVERLLFVNRHLDRAQLLAVEVQQDYAGIVLCLDDPSLLAAYPASIIINATPVGLHEDSSPLPTEVLSRFAPDTFIYDMIYNPAETSLLRQARARSLRAANGLSMLLHQGALSFTLWTGKEAPLDVMRTALY
ncbi:MAG: shikimate dehydrogenase [Ktedonobacteraceae bacterium]|nr:shikimate dehydrogenase [Ktedonobacteraceae bacterium]